MKSLEAQWAARPAEESATRVGMTPLRPGGDSPGRIDFLRTNKGRALLDSGCGNWRGAFDVEKWGVDSVHTLGLRLGRTGAGLGRIPHISAGIQCLQRL